MDATQTPIVIVGAGPAGLACALVLAERGQACVLVGPPADGADTRTTALLMGAVDQLQRAGAWDRIAGRAAPLRVMAILDGSRRLLRSPAVRFRADEIGLRAFGWNVPNGVLTAALDDAVAGAPLVRRLPVRAAAVAYTEGAVRVDLTDGTRIEAALAIAADGRASQTREASGIASRTWTYPQAALAVSFSHSRPHEDVSTEFHTETGPFTLVPLPGDRSSLVCVVRPPEGRRLMALDDAALGREIERRSHGLLGRVTPDSLRSLWPLSGLSIDRQAAKRVALIGEAAHAFPPIGAQGFNLTMRDVATLADLTAGVADPGAPDLLDRFDRARRVDVTTRTFGVDALNRSLLATFLPMHLMRGAGFALLREVGPLRRFAMRQGLAPKAALTP